MGRADFLLDLIRTRNVVAVVALLSLVIASRVFIGNPRSAWVMLLFGVLAFAIGYALSRGG